MQLSIAANETEARVNHDRNPASLKAVAVRHSGYVPPSIANEIKRGAAEIDDENKVVSIFKKPEKTKADQQDQVGELGNAEQFPDAPHGDTLEVPDFEPTVTKAEGIAEKAVEARDDEQIAA